MSLDDLIPFLIFIAIIGFNIFKKIGKKKQEVQAGESVQKPVKKKAFGLTKLVDTIKAEIEKASLAGQQNKGNQKDSIWTTLAQEEASEDQGFDDDFRTDPVKEDIPVIESAEEYNAPIGLPREPEPQVPCKSTGGGFGIKQRKCRKMEYLSPSKMREAVVLSEILAKPIGLRD